MAATSKKSSAKATKATITNRIHFADGNKGGVGKSFLARSLYQWFLDHETPVIGVEADVNSPDFKGIYTDVMLSQFSEDETLGARANSILNTAVESKKNIVVNLPATVHDAFKGWIHHYDIVNLAAENQIQLVKWFVVTGEFDSSKSLEVSLKTFGRLIPHVVVRNQKFTEWEFYNESKSLQALIQETNSQVIDLPKLPVRVASTLLKERLTFEAGRAYRAERFGVVEQGAVRGYLRSAFAAMESTGYLPQ